MIFLRTLVHQQLLEQVEQKDLQAVVKEAKEMSVAVTVVVAAAVVDVAVAAAAVHRDVEDKVVEVEIVEDKAEGEDDKTF